MISESVTCLSSITWLASSCMGNGVPSSEENDDIGDRVPLLSTTLRQLLKSEKACRNGNKYTSTWSQSSTEHTKKNK